MKYESRERGTTLLFALGILTLLAVFGVTFVAVTKTERSASANYTQAVRARLLAHLKDHPRLSAVDADFRHLLASWFNRGFLRLQRIDWRSPANVLERLMHHEAVHPMQGWDDLRRRLAADRRCFGFFHPALPEEPLVFVEVALTDAVASEIAPLIEPSAPERDPYAADTAVF